MSQASSPERVRVDGKFFRLGQGKFFVKGVTYGPFTPTAEHGAFGSPEKTRRDLCLIRELGANVVRLYEVPPLWFLDLLAEHEVKALIDVPWPKHLCFLDSRQTRKQARRSVRETARQCAGHPAVFAFSVVNEIPSDIARWSGIRRVEHFIDELVEEVKSVDAESLCTFASFPPTEFLQPAGIDFVCFNVYLHHPEDLAAYLARLQMLADTKPLMLGELGMDTIREGEVEAGEFLTWQIETAFRRGLAGTVVFSFTDDWFRGGQRISDWAFGLTRADRQLKPAYHQVQRQYRKAPYFPLEQTPKVSVVVASYNGGRTLPACLDSLGRLNYPDYEVILIDDGSTDDTPEIAARYPKVNTLRQENLGLSAARNAGIEAAQGSVVAFTDSDCRADEDWLYYLIGDLVSQDISAVGGHNFLPPEDSPVAAVVMASPGGPAHVMLTDQEAEHIPGCNMAFKKSALEQIGGFDPVFRKAGDDVDICWRLQQSGMKIGFSPAGFVWHYRRATVRAYLRQQRGYGEAEALLAQKHPEYFSTLGGSVWRGRIYSPTRHLALFRRAVIYHGRFGAGFFQKIYHAGPATLTSLVTSLEYYLYVAGSSLVATGVWPILWPLSVASLLLPLGLCTVVAMQANLPRSQGRIWSRPLAGLLCFLQPIERGMARHKSSWNARSGSRAVHQGRIETVSNGFSFPAEELHFWTDGSIDRLQLLEVIHRKLESEGWQIKSDSGWNDYDLEVSGNQWNRLRLIVAGEILDGGHCNLFCRLESFWSLRAQILCGMFSVCVIYAASFLARQLPWSWLLLSVVGLIIWLLDLEKQSVQGNLARAVKEAAMACGLTRLRRDPHTQQLTEERPSLRAKPCP